MLKRMNISTNT